MKRIADLSNKSTKINFDAIYNKSFDAAYKELSNKIIIALKKDTGKTILFKRNELINEFTADFSNLTMKKVSPSNYHPDKYTEELLYNIKNHINDYEKDKITNFINEHLEKIKEVNKDIEQNIPQNIKFNATQTVEFIAKYDAMKILIDRIYLIEQNDSMEIYSKKISKEGYTAPIINMKNYAIGDIEPEDNENEETSKITTKQQVLILKYMMDFLKVSMVDNSVKAKFIKNLTEWRQCAGCRTF